MFSKFFHHKIQEKIRYNKRQDRLFIDTNKFSLKPYKQVILISCGLDAHHSSSTLHDILKDRIDRGLTITHAEHELPRMQTLAATYSSPSSLNIKATEQIVKMLTGLTEDMLILFAFSRGAERMLCFPGERNLESKIKLIDALQELGASREEIHTVHKHISLVKGGQLAKIAYPASVISLLYNDSQHTDFGMVAGGPTIHDRSTISDVQTILKKYDVLEHCEIPRLHLVETPKETKYFQNVYNFPIVSY